MIIKPKVKKTMLQKTSAMLFLEDLTGGPITIAEILKSLRECDEISQKDFAKMLGISKQNLCDIEKSRKAVTPSRAAIFAQKLGYPPTAFIRVALQEELDKAGLKIKIRSVDAA
jgi:transcriptional regulator with XRE-family HTH domain